MPLTVTVSTTFAKAEDVNFVFPIPMRLENERVVLVPFNPSHAEEFYENTKGDASNPLGSFNYISIGPYDSPEHFLQVLWEERIYPDPKEVLFTLYNKNKGASEGTEEMAGLWGYLHASAQDLKAEIGPAITFPKFQGTHVTSNAIGLLMHYALNLPDRGGLGLRRLQWEANAYNVPSIRACQKMGFIPEGTLRWYRTLPPVKGVGTNGKDVRKNDPREDWPGRDTVILALCWDDWENGGREHADAVMERR